jgi:hypothetical protein
MTRLDDLIPEWDHHEVHRRHVAAPPDRVWDAMLDLRVRDLAVTGALTRLRGGPSAWRRESAPEDGDLRVVDAMAPKVLIAERPDEMVLVDVARYAAAKPSRPRAAGDWTVEDFTAYAEPGWSKVGMDFRLVPVGDGTDLATETRVVSTDPATKRSFRAYWFAVRVGSGMIRRDLLRAVDRAVA